MRCDKCKWLKFTADEIKDIYSCHFNGPTIAIDTTLGIHQGIWPVVRPDDFCSKFENIESEKIETVSKLKPLKSPHCKQSIEDIEF